MGKQALEGQRLNAFGMDPDKLVIIGLDTQDGPEHPLYDERIKLKLDEGLVRNIMVYGVIETVTVTKDADGLPLVVVGRQRVRCAREANKRLTAEGKKPILVPCMTKRGEQNTMFGVMISENENRQEDSIITKARKASRMISVCRTTETEAAAAFGVSRPTLSSWLKLLDLDPALVKAIDRGEISANLALEKAGAGADVQKALAAEVRGKKANGKGRPSGAKAARPGKVQVAKMFEKLLKLKRHEHSVPAATCAALCKWLMGEITEDEFFA